MRELFIFYRLASAHAAAAQAAVLKMQTTLSADHPGLQARLLRRPEIHDGQQTWMETYALCGGEGITPALQASIAAAAQALPACLAVPRHTEVFIACA